MNRERIISFTPTTSSMRFDIMSDGRWRGTVKIDCTAGVVYKYDELKSFDKLTRPIMVKKYLVPKSTFNCDLGVKTLWQQLKYEISVEKPEGFGVKITMFFTNEFIKEHFDIIEE